MPRQGRIDYPGTLHHIIGRGIERRRIFKEDKEKKELLRRIKLNLDKSSMKCYAWCIMDNHFHMLLLTGNTKLSEYMRRLLTGYAVYYNKVNKRKGHLFENRYKSILCDKDEYLLSLIRYIHLNPVKVKAVAIEELAKYKWSGHREIVGKAEKNNVIEVNEVLSYFGNSKGRAGKAYVKYINEGVGLEENYESGGLIRSAGGLEEVLKRGKDDKEMFDERILGSGTFVEEILRKTEKAEKKKIHDLNKIIDIVSRHYEKGRKEILNSRVKGVREARDLIVYLGVIYLGKSLRELGEALGIKRAAASASMYRARERIEGKGLTEDILNKLDNVP